MHNINYHMKKAELHNQTPIEGVIQEILSSDISLWLENLYHNNYGTTEYGRCLMSLLSPTHHQEVFTVPSLLQISLEKRLIFSNNLTLGFMKKYGIITILERHCLIQIGGQEFPTIPGNLYVKTYLHSR